MAVTPTQIDVTAYGMMNELKTGIWKYEILFDSRRGIRRFARI